jgi:hypothetical protein
MRDAQAFHQRLKGTFSGILQWQALDALWARVKCGHWYFYQVGEALPDSTLCGEALAARIDALDALLRQEHDFHLCGIVYADHVESPTLIKVYDPGNLGSACSRNSTPTPPRWVLSTTPPAEIADAAPTPNNRKRWWQLFTRG